MPDDPLGIAEYAVTHLHVPPSVVAADLGDVFTILDHQPARLDRAWLAALRAREAAGLSLGELAPMLGVGSRQAAEQRLVRLEAAAAGETKREGNVRAGRRRARDDRQAGESEAARIRALAVALVDRRDEMPEEIGDGFELDAIADALTRWPPGAVPPGEGTVNALRFLLGDLAAAVPAGAALRPVVDAGVGLVGTRSAGSSTI
jgi:hypothetical protein